MYVNIEDLYCNDTNPHLMSVKCVFLVTSLSTTAVTQTQTSSSRRPPATREHHSDITDIMSYIILVTIVKITSPFYVNRYIQIFCRNY